MSASTGVDETVANVCTVGCVAMISTMRTARRPSLSVSQAGTAPFDTMSPCFRLLGRVDPANPFIARQRRDVLPRLQRFCVGGECLFRSAGKSWTTPPEISLRLELRCWLSVSAQNSGQITVGNQTRAALGLKADSLLMLNTSRLIRPSWRGFASWHSRCHIL